MQALWVWRHVQERPSETMEVGSSLPYPDVQVQCLWAYYDGSKAVRLNGRNNSKNTDTDTIPYLYYFSGIYFGSCFYSTAEAGI